MVVVTEPLGSSVVSLVVGIVSVVVPVVGIVTVRVPVVTPKSPLWVTATLTDRSFPGAGLALTVKVASVPSVTVLPAVMLISGSPPGWAASMHSSASRNGFQPHHLCSAADASAAVKGVNWSSSMSPNATSTRRQLVP